MFLFKKKPVEAAAEVVPQANNAEASYGDSEEEVLKNIREKLRSPSGAKPAVQQSAAQSVAAAFRPVENQEDQLEEESLEEHHDIEEEDIEEHDDHHENDYEEDDGELDSEGQDSDDIYAQGESEENESDEDADDYGDTELGEHEETDSVDGLEGEQRLEQSDAGADVDPDEDDDDDDEASYGGEEYGDNDDDLGIGDGVDEDPTSDSGLEEGADDYAGDEKDDDDDEYDDEADVGGAEAEFDEDDEEEVALHTPQNSNDRPISFVPNKDKKTNAFDARDEEDHVGNFGDRSYQKNSRSLVADQDESDSDEIDDIITSSAKIGMEKKQKGDRPMERYLDHSMESPASSPVYGKSISHAVAGAVALDQGLINDAVRAQAQSYIGDLLRAAELAKDRKVDYGNASDISLVGLVTPIIREQVKAWMDQNLAALVNEVVREEIRRLLPNEYK